MNCIPKSILTMDINNYEEFLNDRRHLIADKIRVYYNKL